MQIFLCHVVTLYVFLCNFTYSSLLLSDSLSAYTSYVDDRCNVLNNCTEIHHLFVEYDCLSTNCVVGDESEMYRLLTMLQLI